MSLYADANVLIRLYLDLDAAKIRKHLFAEETSRAWPLPVTDLLRCEVRNGIERMAYESHHGGQWRITPQIAAAAQSLFEEELTAGLLLQRVPASIRELDARFDDLALRHTLRHGFRTYDIMHVAAALHLGCNRFFSFDKNAALLARLEGLTVI